MHRDMVGLVWCVPYVSRGFTHFGFDFLIICFFYLTTISIWELWYWQEQTQRGSGIVSKGAMLADSTAQRSCSFILFVLQILQAGAIYVEHITLKSAYVAWRLYFLYCYSGHVSNWLLYCLSSPDGFLCHQTLWYWVSTWPSCCALQWSLFQLK